MKLGVLDQVPIRQGGNAEQALAESFELAEAVDGWGFSRIWYAEHHNTGSLACTAPEVLIPHVAMRTKQIRVGSGGVMLPHYSSLKVAEQFRLLETLYPGRIDLGIGRAPGSDGRTARALAHGPGSLGLEHFPEQLGDIYGYLADDLPEAHPFHGVKAGPPRRGSEDSDELQSDHQPTSSMPELWLLGSSTIGGAYAAAMGWAFSFAHFISPDGGEEVMRNYHTQFKPSPMWEKPTASLGVSITCADSDDEAEELSWSRWISRIRSNRGQRGGIISPQEARDFELSPQEEEYIEYLKTRSVHGTPGKVRDRLEELAKVYDVDEFIVLTITFDFAARLRSYELLAQEFGLIQQAAPPAELTAEQAAT